MNYGKLFFLSVVATSLVGCSFTQPSTRAVVNPAPAIPQGEAVSTVTPVKAPPGLSSENIKNEYSVPTVTEHGTTTTANSTTSQTTSIVPPGSSLQSSNNTTAPASTPAPIPQVTAAQAAQQQARNGSMGLTVKTNYNQAWKQVGKASSSAGYPVMEEDSSSGTYYVLDKAGSGGVIKRDTPIYQLRVQKQGTDSSVVTVYNAQNQPADPATAQRILSAVKSKLG